MAKRHKNPDGLRNALDNESFLLDFFRICFEPGMTDSSPAYALSHLDC